MWLKPFEFEVFFCEVVQKWHVISDFIIDTVMPDPDPVSPAFIKEWRFHYMGIATLGALRYRCVFKK